MRISAAGHWTKFVLVLSWDGLLLYLLVGRYSTRYIFRCVFSRSIPRTPRSSRTRCRLEEYLQTFICLTDRHLFPIVPRTFGGYRLYDARAWWDYCMLVLTIRSLSAFFWHLWLLSGKKRQIEDWSLRFRRLKAHDNVCIKLRAMNAFPPKRFPCFLFFGVDSGF